jgi:phosphoglycerate dehydrogenase-like enzyme
MLFSAADLKRLRSLVNMRVWEGSRMPDDRVEKFLPDAAFIIGQTALPRERLERAKYLKAIINVEGNFPTNIDYEYCFARGIHVLNGGAAFGPAVAEMALGFALALARGIPEADRLFRKGKEVYGRLSNQTSFLVSGAEVGFIGFGNLGRALRKLLEPFRCRIRVYDPWLPTRWLAEFGMTPSSLEELLASSQIVFVLAGVTVGNRAMLDKGKLDLMRKGTCLVLVSRAALVDFEALTRKLATGDIRAAVDVFPEEPFSKKHPIRRRDNVILSAHRAGGLTAAYHLMGEMVVDDLGQVLKGLPPVRLQRAEREIVIKMRSSQIPH